VLREDGILTATTSFVSKDRNPAADPASKSRDYVRRHWKYSEPSAQPTDLPARVQSHSLCISGMAFQDAWNIDIERLRRCCIHVATEKKLVPFCAYYLTSSTGRRIGFES